MKISPQKDAGGFLLLLCLQPSSVFLVAIRTQRPTETEWPGPASLTSCPLQPPYSSPLCFGSISSSYCTLNIREAFPDHPTSLLPPVSITASHSFPSWSSPRLAAVYFELFTCSVPRPLLPDSELHEGRNTYRQLPAQWGSVAGSQSIFVEWMNEWIGLFSSLFLLCLTRLKTPEVNHNNSHPLSTLC